MQIEKLLQAHGYKVTKPRNLVFQTLQKSDKALNAYEIVDVLKAKGHKITPASVYRVLDVLQKCQITHYIKHEQKYKICTEHHCQNNAHCHHQFICKSCNDVTELHINDQKFFQKLSTNFPSIAIQGHYLELFGLCKKCNQ